MTFGIMSLSTMTFNMRALIIMALCKALKNLIIYTTLKIMSVVMLNVIILSVVAP